jgi:hypothetical protein
MVASEGGGKTDTRETVTDAAADAIAQTPFALFGALFASGGAPAALGAVRLLARNLPLVVLVGLIGLLLWPTGSPTGHDDRISRTGDGFEDRMPSTLRH